MTDARDVVIIGGGAMGGAVATFLLDDPAFAGSVTVIERDPTFRTASSALSAAGIRQQFSTPENIRMSRFSFDWIRDTLGITIHEGGYLYLAPPGSVEAIEQNHAVQRAEGADVELLDRDRARRALPVAVRRRRGARLARPLGRGLVRRLRAPPGAAVPGSRGRRRRS